MVKWLYQEKEPRALLNLQVGCLDTITLVGCLDTITLFYFFGLF